MNELTNLLKIIRPFAEAKLYNPNRSTDPNTSRTINVTEAEYQRLREFYLKFADGAGDEIKQLELPL